MPTRDGHIVVAGHICLDIIPSLAGAGTLSPDWLTPGRLQPVGPASVATGGAVSNTGIALHRLGERVQLMAKIGDDLFGHAILDIISGIGTNLTDSMIIAPGEPTSYTIVVNPPDSDRMFMHCTGANDTFLANDLRMSELSNASWFHFGYPPLMRSMYEDNSGSALRDVFSAAKAHLLPTSLDMARPDRQSPAGRADWRRILRTSLPLVDVFMPSIEEIWEMLRTGSPDGLHAATSPALELYAQGAVLLRSIAEELLEMGCAIVVLKLGEHGLYLRSTAAAERLRSAGFRSRDDIAHWQNRELYVTCFAAQVQGTTGAGDCTIAGFIAGMLRGLTPEETMRGAVGVGACCVEYPDATSGITQWAAVSRRIADGWPHRDVKLPLQDWHLQAEGHVRAGPHDSGVNL